MKQVIFITGGSDGFGKILAKQLSKKHQVIIFAPNEDKLKKTAKSIGCAYYVGDVTDYQSVNSAIKDAVKKYGRIDCLVNNAGIICEGEIDKIEPELIKKTVEVNTVGAMFATRAVIPFMKKRKNGLILNIISQAGFYAKPGRGVYVSSKWALTGLTKNLALDLEPHGIRVTGIYPGKMSTNLFKNAGISKKMADAIDPQLVAKTVEFILGFPANVVFPEVGIKKVGQ